MKKLYLLLSITGFILIFTGFVSAQTYHFQEGFTTNAQPTGWLTTNVAWSTTHNNGLYTGDYSVKLKPNESFLMLRVLNTADVLQFYVKVRDTTSVNDFHLYIEKSYDKLTWTEIGKDPCNMENDSVFQLVNIAVNDPATEIYLRFHAASLGGTNTLGLCYIDDVSVTKLALAPNDATLTDLTYNGTSIEGFTASTLSYSLEVPYYVNQVIMGGTPNNPASSMIITNPSNLRGNEESRTGTVAVTSQDGTVIKSYKIIFTVSDYIYKAGFITTGDGAVPFAGWDGSYTYTTNTVPMGNHNEFEGQAALKFVRGQPDKPGYLSTANYVKSDTLTFWLAVEQADGVESLLVQKKVGGGVSINLGNIASADMTPDWKKFTYIIGEDDSTKVIFTPTLTAEGLTRIWIDDIALKGKKVSGVSVEEIDRESRILIFPNPSCDIITIRSSDRNMKHLTITDLTGRKVMTRNIDQVLNSFDIRYLPDGVYFVTLIGAGKSYTTKFIKY